MKLGALHLYLVIISAMTMIISTIKLFEGGSDGWIIPFMVGFIIWVVYVCLGVDNAWRLENG